jgi:hypothetical protein
LNQKLFFSDINTDKTLLKTVETSQPPLNVLPAFIITEKKFLVQSLYVKKRSLLSLHIARTLEEYPDPRSIINHFIVPM